MLLLAGASGLLGGALVREALARGTRITAITHRHPLRAMDGLDALRVDLRDVGALRASMRRLNPTIVINCAAYTNVDWCETHRAECEQLHVAAAAVMAEEAQRAGARFIQISTDSVFDGERGGYTEQDATNPLNVYAATKLAGEAAVLGAHASALVLRTNIYGWNSRAKSSLGEWILGELEAGREVPGFVDVVTTPILTNDFAELLLDLAGREIGGVVHLAGGEACSKYEFARRLAAVFGFDPGRVIARSVTDARFEARRPLDTSLDCRVAVGELGERLPDVETGLRRFKALRDNGFVEQLRALSR